MIILSVVWAETALCFVAIFLNEMFHASCYLPCVVKRASEQYRCIFGWRQIEGLVILIDSGCKFWVILKYASVDGGMSNVCRQFKSHIFPFLTHLIIEHLSSHSRSFKCILWTVVLILEWCILFRDVAAREQKHCVCYSRK